MRTATFACYIHTTHFRLSGRTLDIFKVAAGLRSFAVIVNTIGKKIVPNLIIRWILQYQLSEIRNIIFFISGKKDNYIWLPTRNA